MKESIPGEIIEQIILTYLNSKNGEADLTKGAKVACISKVYRDFVRGNRFYEITVGETTYDSTKARTPMLNSYNAKKITSDLAWAKRNKVDTRSISHYVAKLNYTDSVELVKLFLFTTPIKCLSYISLDLNIDSKFVRVTSSSYLYDLACFLGMVKSTLSYISNGNMNTLRFHSDRMLESIRILHVTLLVPHNATKDYVIETINDIARCKNCTNLFLMESSFITSTLFRKLTMRLSWITIEGCELLADDDFVWFLTRNKAHLTEFVILNASCALQTTWKILRQCTEMTKLVLVTTNPTHIPFKAIIRANNGMLKLQKLNIRAMISGASDNAVLELMLTQSRGGALVNVDINCCIGLNDHSAIKRGLFDAYKTTSAMITMLLNSTELISINTK